MHEGTNGISYDQSNDIAGPSSPIPLTTAQRDTLEVFWNFLTDNGFQPSYRELCELQDRSSPNAIMERVKILVAKGWLARWNPLGIQSRSLRLLRTPDGRPFRGLICLSGEPLFLTRPTDPAARLHADVLEHLLIHGSQPSLRELSIMGGRSRNSTFSRRLIAQLADRGWLFPTSLGAARSLRFRATPDGRRFLGLEARRT